LGGSGQNDISSDGGGSGVGIIGGGTGVRVIGSSSSVTSTSGGRTSIGNREAATSRVRSPVAVVSDVGPNLQGIVSVDLADAVLAEIGIGAGGGVLLTHGQVDVVEGASIAAVTASASSVGIAGPSGPPILADPVEVIVGVTAEAGVEVDVSVELDAPAAVGGHVVGIGGAGDEVEDV
jgi:hypothetical protein